MLCKTTFLSLTFNLDFLHYIHRSIIINSINSLINFVSTLLIPASDKFTVMHACRRVAYTLCYIITKQILLRHGNGGRPVALECTINMCIKFLFCDIGKEHASIFGMLYCFFTAIYGFK